MAATMAMGMVRGASMGTAALMGGATLGAGILQSQAIGAGAKAYTQQAGSLADEAIIAEQQGFVSAEMVRRQTEEILSTQRSLYAASGVLLEGSPLMVMQETARRGEMDALLTQYQAKLDQARLLQQGQMAQAAASAQKKASKAGLLGGILG